MEGSKKDNFLIETKATKKDVLSSKPAAIPAAQQKTHC